jgi:hypothetical protein
LYFEEISEEQIYSQFRAEQYDLMIAMWKGSVDNPSFIQPLNVSLYL